MDIRNLINLLPPIFKSGDTYKVNGRGFLERYLEICGSYLTDVITPEIDNILDIIQIDTTPKEYLNYLWEFLGEMPFANIYNVDKDKWALHYDGTRDNENLWLIDNNKPISLNDQTARDLIKYSLSLYKIRGTKKFFEVILRLYGLEPIITHDDPDYDIITPHVDTSYIDKDSLDIDYGCRQCSTINISLDDRYHELVFADINGVIIMGSDKEILTGKSLYILPNYLAEPTILEFTGIMDTQDESGYNLVDHLEDEPLLVDGFIVYSEDQGVFGVVSGSDFVIGNWVTPSGLSSADYNFDDYLRDHITPTIFKDLRDGSEYMWDENGDLVKYDGSYVTDLQFFDLKQLVTAYNEYDGRIDFSNMSYLPSAVRMFVSLRRLFESFFDRFTPYNANIQLKYDGIAPDDSLSFDVLYEDPENSIITNTQPEINLSVVRNSKWPIYDGRYQVSRDGIDWSGNYHSEDTYRVTNPGTYYFKMVSSDIVVPVSVGTSVVQQPYSLYIKEGNILYLSDSEDGTAIITPVAKLGDIGISTIVESPSGSKNELGQDTPIKISEPGTYKIYISSNPSIYTNVYVYDKPASLNSRVDIPYGLRVTFSTFSSVGEGTSYIGGPDSDSVPVAIYGSNTAEVIDIEPWLRDPQDPSKILWGSEFIVNPDQVICFLYRKPETDRYYQIDGTTATTGIAKPVSLSEAKELLNTMLKLNNTSAILTLAQVNISPYYSPHSIDQSTQVARRNYIHNPLVINTVSEITSDYLNIGPGLSSDVISISNSTSTKEDVFILGALMFDNRYQISNFFIWDSSSPDGSFNSPYYTATIQVDNNSEEIDISNLRFKDINGNTISRQIVALGRSNLNLVNSVPIVISDTGTQDNGLYIEPIEGSGWTSQVLLSPLSINRADGSTIEISKIYTFRLNNSLLGRQSARFKLKVMFNGVYYDDVSEGGIVVDDKGNSYNIRTEHIEDTIRYYIPRTDGEPLVLGNHGHIFSVKSVGSDSAFNVMLNIVIDEEAGDKLDVRLSMNPEVFYLPSNGIKAITNMIASRPYKFEPGSGGVFIFGPLEEETDDNYNELIHDPVYGYITTNIGDHTFTAEGIVDPLSVISGTLEYPSSVEKVFIVHKNQ